MQFFPAELRIGNPVATVTGADDSLESINTTEYPNGAIVMVTATGMLYRLDKTDTATEDLPDIVAPKQGGTGRWRIMGSGAEQFQFVDVFHAEIPPQTSVEGTFGIIGATSISDLILYNITDSALPAGVTTGPVRITGSEAANMRFLNATAATVAAATVAFRMAVFQG